jgi:hypothetical protein
MDVESALSMKDKAHGFAIRKDRRDLQRPIRLLASLLKVALLVTAMGFYWRWHNGDPGLGPLFLSERKLVAANATYLVPAFGLSGSVALIAAAFKVLRARPEVRPEAEHANSTRKKQGLVSL